MKILAVADVEDNLLYDHFRKERTQGVELIISCGDLRADYLDFLMTMVIILWDSGDASGITTDARICIPRGR